MEQSLSNLLLDDELDSGECPQLHTEYAQKPLGLIDQVQDIIEENNQYFGKGMPEPNKRFLEETEHKNKFLGNHADMLRHHFRLNHLSFRKLKDLETLGIITCILRNVKPPNFPACKFVRQTRTQWRNKG